MKIRDARKRESVALQYQDPKPGDVGRDGIG